MSSYFKHILFKMWLCRDRIVLNIISLKEGMVLKRMPVDPVLWLFLKQLGNKIIELDGDILDGFEVTVENEVD